MRKVIVIGAVVGLAACASPEDRWGWMFEETATRPAVEAPEGGGAATASSSSISVAASTSSSAGGQDVGGGGAGGAPGSGGADDGTGGAAGGEGPTHPECTRDLDCYQFEGRPLFTCTIKACVSGTCQITGQLQTGQTCLNGNWCDAENNQCRGSAACVIPGRGTFWCIGDMSVRGIDFTSFLTGQAAFCGDGHYIEQPCVADTVCTVHYHEGLTIWTAQGYCQP